MMMTETAPVVRENRIEPRHKVFLLGSLVHDGQTRRAHMLDVSHGGARLHCDAPPPPGAQVALAVGTLNVPGEVRWARDQRFGVRFDQRLTADSLGATIS